MLELENTEMDYLGIVQKCLFISIHIQHYIHTLVYWLAVILIQAVICVVDRYTITKRVTKQNREKM